MNEKRGFCEECRADRLYTIEAKESKTVLKAKHIILRNRKPYVKTVETKYMWQN